MTDLPLPGEHDWALKLNTAIEQRGVAITQDLQNAIDTLAGAVGDEYTPRAEFNPVKAAVETGRLSEASLMSTYVARADYPGITVDTTAGTALTVGSHIIAYDSGWRTIIEWDDTGTVTHGSLRANMAPMPNEPGFLRIRRRDDKVTLAMKGFEATGVVIYNPPFNFRRIDWSPLYLQTGSGKTVNYSDAIYLPSGEYPRMETVEWETLHALPTSLPGIPA